MKTELINKLKKIKIVVFDLEGVLVKHDYEDSSYMELLKSKINDFCAFLQQKGIKCGIISAGSDNDKTRELETTNLDFVETASLNKVGKAQVKLCEYELKFEEMLYVGDCVIDIPVMQKAGISMAPGNARREAKRYADVVIKEDNPLMLITFIQSLLNAKE